MKNRGERFYVAKACLSYLYENLVEQMAYCRFFIHFGLGGKVVKHLGILSVADISQNPDSLESHVVNRAVVIRGGFEDRSDRT